jgi:hypothetical protein
MMELLGTLGGLISKSMEIWAVSGEQAAREHFVAGLVAMASKEDETGKAHDARKAASDKAIADAEGTVTTEVTADRFSLPEDK